MLVRQDDASRRSVVAILRLINETLEEKGTIIGPDIDLCVTTCKVTKCSGKIGSLVQCQIYWYLSSLFRTLLFSVVIKFKRFLEMSTMIFFSRHPFFDWWHLVLFRLWANAQASTHSGGRSVFPRFRHPLRDDTPLEVHQGNVRTRRIRSVMSCRSGITWISTIISTFSNNGC